jgi:diguanylate cyclase (GGDEF)-like protein/PAS domain S-box-containing protein
LFLSQLPPDVIQPVLEALPMPVFFKDRAGIYRGCNLAFTTLLGLCPADVVGKSVFDLSPPDLAQVYFEADEALMSAGQDQRYESQVQTPSGQRLDVIFYKSVLRDTEGQVSGLVGTILDITERKRMEQQLAEMATRDPLTGLMNRRAILSHLERLHADRRSQRQPLCLLMCDVDHFKSINDRHGHAVGDEVLTQVAQVLRQHLRDGDQVGRIGGEEFLVVLQSTEPEQLAQVGERLRQVGRVTPLDESGHDVLGDAQHWRGAQPAGRRGLGQRRVAGGSGLVCGQAHRP